LGGGSGRTLWLEPPSAQLAVCNCCRPVPHGGCAGGRRRRAASAASH